jgi:hypothetical protein
MQKTLWIAALGVGRIHLLKLFYAANENDAKEQAARLERENDARCEDLRCMPFGFRIVRSTWPGIIEVETE